MGKLDKALIHYSHRFGDKFWLVDRTGRRSLTVSLLVMQRYFPDLDLLDQE